MTQQKATKSNVKRKQMIKLVAIPVLMFGFGFALVPLYDVFCAVTGINGKTGRVEAATVDPREVDTSRNITVKFLANTGTGLAWKFEPVVKSMEVHPGQIYEAMYRVSSRSDKDTLGQAIPSLSPGIASLYFNKTECFCFSQQQLKANETRDMPLRFVINHDLPEDIAEVTLSYTFFNIEKDKS
jgi:cytochrome c oxidase assembly protein subunit 11